jgi:hypothetical protein
MIVIKRTHQVGYYGVDQYGRNWATVRFEGRTEVCSCCGQEMTSGYISGWREGGEYACDKCARMEYR